MADNKIVTITPKAGFPGLVMNVCSQLPGPAEQRELGLDPQALETKPVHGGRREPSGAQCARAPGWGGGGCHGGPKQG